MNVDTTFLKRRHEKQIRFERSLLRELSLEALKKSVGRFFGTAPASGGDMFGVAVEEGFYDIALEAYILGSRYSRIGYYGKPLEEVLESSEEERESYALALYDFITFWLSGRFGSGDVKLQETCRQFVKYWFIEGFNNGKLRYKMRLH